jgi:hypothetical protein
MQQRRINTYNENEKDNKDRNGFLQEKHKLILKKENNFLKK